MASTRPTGSRLTALLAAAATVGLALLPVAGPWQPASVILGWVAVVLVGFSLMVGHAGALGAGCATLLVRTGVHGLAGAGLVDLVASAGLLLLVVEAGSASLEGRLVPLHTPAVVARSVAVSVGGAAMVMMAAGLVGGATLEVAAVWGLGAGLLIALLVVALSR